MDITRSLPFATDTVSKILIEHCLKHVDSCDGMRSLIEAHRVLEPSGILRICVPILNRLTPEKIRDICRTTDIGKSTLRTRSGYF
ncbi:MAG: methyltransferase domain-containing protein [Gammaproteobacteria bacterium]